MKTIIPIEIIGVALLVVSVSRAGQLNVTFDNVPAQVQCGQTWTNNDVILSFNESIASEAGFAGGAGYCDFEVDPGYVWLYPCRLVLDFSLLNQPVSSISVSIGYDFTGLFAYQGTNNIAQDEDTSTGTLSLTFTNLYPDYCALFAFEGTVNGITISTGVIYPPTINVEQTNGVVTVFWATNQNSFALETSSDLTNPSGWIAQTNNILFDGTNFFYNIVTPVGNEYFRLRH